MKNEYIYAFQALRVHFAISCLKNIVRKSGILVKYFTYYSRMLISWTGVEITDKRLFMGPVKGQALKISGWY
jgi:hypothetical protein